MIFEVKCPQCGTPLQIEAETGQEVEITCPQCGNTFSVVTPAVGAGTNSPQVPSGPVPTSEPVYTGQPAPSEQPEELKVLDESAYIPSGDEDDSSQKAWIIAVCIAAALFLGGLAFWYFRFYVPQQKELSDFNLAKSKKDVNAARNFLAQHKDDATAEHRTFMLGVVREFVNDSTSWVSAKNIAFGDYADVQGVTALEGYLKAHPNGLHKAEAQSRLQVLKNNIAEQKAAAEEAARYKEIDISFTTNGSTLSGGYNCNYGSSEYTDMYGNTRYRMQSQDIYVPDGKQWRVTDWNFHYGLDRMYYPKIVLDNGYSIQLNDAYAQNFAIPGGHYFHIATPVMNSMNGDFYEYSLTISLYEEDE